MFRHFRPCLLTDCPDAQRVSRTQRAQRSSPQTRSAWEVTCSTESSFTVARLSLALFWVLVLRTDMHHYCACPSYHPSFKTLKRTSRTHLWFHWRDPVFFFFSQMIAHESWAELECLSVALWIRTSWRHTSKGVTQQIVVIDIALYIA